MNRPPTYDELVQALREAARALRPVAGCVFNDNGDITVNGSINYGHYSRAYFALKNVNATLELVGEL